MIVAKSACVCDFAVRCTQKERTTLISQWSMRWVASEEKVNQLNSGVRESSRSSLWCVISLVLTPEFSYLFLTSHAWAPWALTPEFSYLFLTSHASHASLTYQRSPSFLCTLKSQTHADFATCIYRHSKANVRGGYTAIHDNKKHRYKWFHAMKRGGVRWKLSACSGLR